MITSEQLREKKKAYQNNPKQVTLENEITRILTELEKQTLTNVFSIVVYKKTTSLFDNSCFYYEESLYKQLMDEFKNRGFKIEQNETFSYFIITI